MFSELLALSSLVLTCIFGFFALRIARRMYTEPPEWIEDTLEGFLKPGEDGKNMVDHLADRFGKGFRMSLLAQKSGDVRHQKMIEKRVFQAAQEKSPEIGLIVKAMDQFGLGDLATPENLPALLQVANKYGLLSFLGGGGQKQESRGGLP